MLRESFLNGMTFIDLSHRLPGPFCGKLLSDLGASVIKIEDHKFQDPFLSGLFAQFDSGFLSWYENLNNTKEIRRFDFNNENDQKTIYELVKNADGVIMGLPESTRIKLKLTDNDLNFNKAFISIELLASRKVKKSMHDLNAMSLTGLLSLYVADKTDKIVAPPFLPIAGISFGHKAATDLLAAYIKALKDNKSYFVKTYLDEATEDIYGLFWPSIDRQNKRVKFLHNGLYPCYALYQTKDNKYIALAAVEEKFWLRFCELFSLDKNLDRFYQKDESVFTILSNKMKQYNQSEIESMTESEDLCLSIILDPLK
jgi:alpha-methylacyl-CoA racemase